MKAFFSEDDLRAALHRRAEDVTPAAPPWEDLARATDVIDLRSAREAAPRARRAVVVLTAAALFAGVVGLRLAQRDDPTPPPAVDIGVDEQVPFDPRTASAIWPEGRDGTTRSWLRSQFEEPQAVRPPASDDPREVALAYLRDRFGSTPVVLDDAAQHGRGTGTYHWRVRTGSQDATGRVYLRRMVLPMSFRHDDQAWVVVGAVSDHLRLTAARHGGGRLELGLDRHDADFSATATVRVDAGTESVPLGGSGLDGSLFGLDQPRTVDVAVPEAVPIVVRAHLVGRGGAPLTLSELALDPPSPGAPGRSLAGTGSVLATEAGETATEVAERYLRDHFRLGDDLRVEPTAPTATVPAHIDIRFRSSRIGTGIVRLRDTPGRPGHWDVAAVVGDGLSVDSMSVRDDSRRVTLSSVMPGEVSVVLRNGRGKPIAQGATVLPGVDMLTGLYVKMAQEPDPGTAPTAEFRVVGPHGVTVALYCLPN